MVMVKENNDTLLFFQFLYEELRSYLSQLKTISLSNVSLIAPLIVYLVFALSSSLVCSLSDRLELSDKLIQSAFYSGKKVNKITYEEIASSNRSYIEFPGSDTVDIISSIYYDDNGDGPRVKDIKINSMQNSSGHASYHRSPLARNLYKRYGRTTVFKVDLLDLERMVNCSIISEGQALFFWEILLQDKTDCLRNINGKMMHQLASDVYLFNCIPIKETLFIALSLVVLYVFIIRTYSLNIKNSFSINCIGIVSMLYIIELLYENKHYFSSSLIFIQLMYFFKCFLDSFVLGLGYTRDDFEIFSQNLSAKNAHQFILKFLILLLLTVFAGVFSICRFHYFVNYFLFYVSLFTLIVFLSNCLESETPSILQPVKNLLIFALGLFNFLLSKFHMTITKCNYRQYSVIKDNEFISGSFPDSLYLISDLFTMFCFHYLNGFIYAQTKALILNKSSKPFTGDDVLWLIGLIISGVIVLVGLIKEEYICFILSVYLCKIVLDYFSKIFNVKCSRAVIDVIFFSGVYINQVITVKADEYLTSLLFYNYFNLMGGYSSFIRSLCKCVGLVQMFYLIFMNFEYLYSTHYERSPELEEMAEEAVEEIYRKVELTARTDKKKLKQFKSFQIHVIRPEKQINLLSFGYILFDFGHNYVNICLVLFFMRRIETSYLALVIYTGILIVLSARVFFILSEFRNNNEYLFAFIITLVLGIRLLVLTSGSPVLYFICHVNVLCLVLLYCMIDRRKHLVTFIIMIHLYAASFTLKSNFLFIDLLSLLFLPITFSILHSQNYSRMSEDFAEAEEHCDSTESGGRDAEGERSGCSFIFVIPVVAVFAFQLYGFKNVLGLMEGLNAAMKLLMFDCDVMKMFVLMNYDEKRNEFEMFEAILDYLKGIFVIKGIY